MPSSGHSTPSPLGKTFAEEMPSTSSSLLLYLGPPTPLATLMLSIPRPSPPTKPLPLIEAGGEHSFQLVHKPFSLIELKQIKTDLRSYSDNPDKYINVFQDLTTAYKLICKDPVVVLGKTLSDFDQGNVIKETRKPVNNLYLSDYTVVPNPQAAQ